MATIHSGGTLQLHFSGFVLALVAGIEAGIGGAAADSLRLIPIWATPSLQTLPYFFWMGPPNKRERCGMNPGTSAMYLR